VVIIPKRKRWGEEKKVERERREKDFEYASYVIHNIRKY
jgi:hypothetical protein